MADRAAVLGGPGWGTAPSCTRPTAAATAAPRRSRLGRSGWPPAIPRVPTHRNRDRRPTVALDGTAVAGPWPRLTLAFPARLLRVAAVMAVVAAIVSCGGERPAAPDPAPEPPVTVPPPPQPSDPAPAPEPEPLDPLPSPPPPPAPAPAGPPAGPPVLLGAGDIAPCDAPGPVDTARLLDRIGGTVFTLGDHTYPTTTREHLVNCYDPTWGRHRLRTRPTLGNHEYENHGPRDYFDYFGPSAGPHGRGYYSFQVGEWLAISLDSMNGSTDQTSWLRAT